MSPPAGGAQLLQSLLMACEDKAMFKKNGTKNDCSTQYPELRSRGLEFGFWGPTGCVLKKKKKTKYKQDPNEIFLFHPRLFLSFLSTHFLGPIPFPNDVPRMPLAQILLNTSCFAGEKK